MRNLKTWALRIITHTCLDGIPYVLLATRIRVRGMSKAGQLAANVSCDPVDSTGESGDFI